MGIKRGLCFSVLNNFLIVLAVLLITNTDYFSLVIALDLGERITDNQMYILTKGYVISK